MGSSGLICSFIGVVFLLKTAGFSAASRINLALNGKVIQSTRFWSWGQPELAIDGNSSPDWLDGSCSSTTEQAHPWWRLELPAVYRVTEIEITNRGNVRNRINGLEIHIGNSLVNHGNDNPRCAVFNDNPDCSTQTVKCWGMEGRFINLYQSSAGKTYLQLCEVKVYGGLGPRPSISIQADQRNFTLVGTRLCWSDALLYCRDSHWDLLSLTGPEDQEMIDELVASAPFPLTSHLWVGLRRSRTGSWFWMSGDPMDFTQWKQGSQHSSPCGGVSSIERSTWMKHKCGEHLNFICFTGPTDGVKKLHFYSSTRENQTRCSSA